VVLKNWLIKKFTAWLVHEHDRPEMPLCDFDHLSLEIRPCDVLLVEGRSRVSDIIKNITQTIWTHSALYIGRLRDIDDPALRALIQKFYKGDPEEQLIVEALLGEGTVMKPLSKYRGEHLRICRPRNLSRKDAQHIIGFAAHHLGTEYDLRQLADMARFMCPYSFVPRRWRSTLFEYHAGISTRTVCSSMIAAAFANVHYPVMPLVHRGEDGKPQLYKRNPRLYTPRDFDYSPYFDIIKYPMFGLDDLAVYRQLPWNKDGVICNDENDCYIPDPAQASAKVPVALAKRRANPQVLDDSGNSVSDSSGSKVPPSGKVILLGKKEECS
jgi:hypothetical protein